MNLKECKKSGDSEEYNLKREKENEKIEDKKEESEYDWDYRELSRK